MPEFSVIITTHNRPTLLREAITSVLAQTVQDYEVIVIDDGSAPPARTPNDRRVRVVRRSDPGGPAAARNAGVRESRGDYLVFLDDDDLFTPNRLALGQEGPRRESIRVCDAGLLDQRSQAWMDRVRRGLTRRQGEGRIMRDEPWRRAAIPHVGQVTILAQTAPMFDERFWVAEDVDWWIRASRECGFERIGGVGYIKRIYDRPRVYSREDLDSMLRSTLLVLEENGQYFAEHKGAAAYRWRRIGFLYERLGRRSLARDAFRRAAMISGDPPSRWNMTRTYLPVPQRMRPRL